MPVRLQPVVFAVFCLLAISACDSKQEPMTSAPGQERSAAPVTPAAPSPDVVAASVQSFLLETAVKQSDTFESLRKQYGEANVIKSELPGAEGETSQGWILFPDDPGKKLLIYLDESDLHPASIVVEDLSSKWHLQNSVRMGTDITGLQALNQKVFSFYGFYWDYGGVISDWNGGALDKNAAGSSHIGIHLCPPENAKLPDNYLSGDGTFKSDDPLALKFPPIVCEIGLSFPQAE